jgi:hypothetical protein
VKSELGPAALRFYPQISSSALHHHRGSASKPSPSLCPQEKPPSWPC